MNIITEAKKIKRAAELAKKEAEKQISAEQLALEKEKREKEMRDDSIFKSLEHINNSTKFAIERSDNDNFGEIAKLFFCPNKKKAHPWVFLGSVCFKTDYSKFR